MTRLNWRAKFNPVFGRRAQILGAWQTNGHLSSPVIAFINEALSITTAMADD